jgi:long-chain acyl-CoA synthetase
MRFSLGTLLDSRARRWPEEVVLTEDGTDLTWAALREQARRVACALVRDGVEPGHRVAYVGKNGLPFSSRRRV